MPFDHEKRTARRLLTALEDNTLNTTDTWHLVSDADPALVHFIFAWLRAWYPPTHPAAEAVLGRIATLCTQHPKAAQLAKEGAKDSIVAWYEDEYDYRDHRRDEFISLVVEKLEG